MSHRTKIIVGIIIVLIIIGGLFWYWNKWTGTIKFGADTIFGCQNTSAISSVVGSPGSNLITYNLFGHDVTVNQIITPYLDNVQKEVVALKTGYNFDNVQTYNSRSKRGGGGLSLHSYGIALDINPSANPQQGGARSEIQTDIPASIIEVFRKNGFQWGGDWIGEADPMHFEWYGSDVYGSFLDEVSRQKIITDIAATIDKVGVPISNGDYRVTLESINPHKVHVTAKGYEDTNFDLGLICFQSRQLDITLRPLADNTPGSISGKIVFQSNLSPLIPATIYLDGRYVGTSAITGEYTISNVRYGVHKVEAKILMFPGTTITTPNMTKGENLQNQNIIIGK